jgi:hypothetical protein
LRREDEFIHAVEKQLIVSGKVAMKNLSSPQLFYRAPKRFFT